MQQCQWKSALMSLLVLGNLVLPVCAQDAEVEAARMEPLGGRRSFHQAAALRRTGFAGTLEKTLGLTPEQRDSVRGLLAQQHERMAALKQETAPKYQSVREETDGKIRALLNPEQQKKFDVLLAQQNARRAQFKRGGKKAE